MYNQMHRNISAEKIKQKQNKNKTTTIKAFKLNNLDSL